MTKATTSSTELTRRSAHSTLRLIRESLNAALANTSTVHYLMAAYLEDIGQSPDDFNEFILDLSEIFEISLLEERLGSRKGIPPVSHRIWITNDDEPKLPPDHLLRDISQHYAEAFPDHLNYFWVNSSKVASHLKEALNDLEQPIIFRDIAELRLDPLFESIKILIEARKFVLATDLLRICILRKFGGIYSDLGAKISRDVVCLAAISDYLAILSEKAFLQTSVLGAAADSDLINLMHGYLCNPQVFPACWLKGAKFMPPLMEVAALSGPMFSVFTHLFSQPNWRFLVLANDGKFVHWRASRSWYGPEAKFGNANIPDSSATLIDYDKIVQHQVKASSAVRTWNCPKAIQIRLEILVGLSGYFDSYPTKLCQIMKYNGSDKALGWHCYAYVYNYLLPIVREKSESLLEIGLGTNYLDTVSNMGVSGVPGASLRGWKEFLSAEIVGADVDKRVLFQEPGINTFFVDQTDRRTIEELWISVHAKPTIIIDDGLHTFDANVNVIEVTSAANDAMRVLVVEDILRRFLRDWDRYLEVAGHTAALIELPHEKNDKDNILLFLFTGNIEWRERLRNQKLNRQ